METLSGVSLCVKIFGMLTPRLLGLFYSKEKIEGLLEIQPVAMNDCITLQHSSRDARCHLSISNFSPFTISVDRIEAKIIANGVHATVHQLFPQELRPATKAIFYLEGNFSASQSSLKLGIESEYVRVDVKAYIVTKPKKFTISKSLEQIKNFTVRE